MTSFAAGTDRCQYFEFISYRLLLSCGILLFIIHLCCFAICGYYVLGNFYFIIYFDGQNVLDILQRPFIILVRDVMLLMMGEGTEGPTVSRTI